MPAVVVSHAPSVAAVAFAAELASVAAAAKPAAVVEAVADGQALVAVADILAAASRTLAGSGWQAAVAVAVGSVRAGSGFGSAMRLQGEPAGHGVTGCRVLDARRLY